MLKENVSNYKCGQTVENEIFGGRLPLYNAFIRLTSNFESRRLVDNESYIITNITFSHNAELKKELLAALEKVKNEELNDQEKAKCTLKTFELGCSSKSPSIQAVCIGTFMNSSF